MPSALSVILLFNIPPCTHSDPAANEVDLVIVPIFNGTDTEAPRVAADPGTANRVAGSGTLQLEGFTPHTCSSLGSPKVTERAHRSRTEVGRWQLSIPVMRQAFQPWSPLNSEP